MPTRDWTCLTFTTCLSLHFFTGKMELIWFFRCHLKLLLQEYFIKPVQFSRSVVSDSCASSRWWNPAISSSVVPFSSCPVSIPASGSFPMGQLFAWGGQSIGVSASASVFPMNTQDWAPLGWTASRGDGIPVELFQILKDDAVKVLHSI